MGIPRFYRLITEQFPDVSEHTSFKAGFSLPVDNLYLDANGIIHNCAHKVYFDKPVKPRLSRPVGDRTPNDSRKPSPAPTPAQKELQLFQAITDYMDQLLKFVNPRRLFYIAIDGPAPLAKQAQQRQRRYKTADEKTAEELATFDSTAITPGTNFMYKLSKFINFYIRKMLSTDPVWQNIQVIFSSSAVAGEGEHKIVGYIREQQNKDNLVHCMYGLDADLFMLSLSTHCPKFYLLREDQFNTSTLDASLRSAKVPKPAFSETFGFLRGEREAFPESGSKPASLAGAQPRMNDTLFYKVDIGLLRKEIFNYWGSLGGNETNLIDDFIFVCFLVGNDFLHALPCCHDLSDSINFIMDLRKEVLGSSYITNNTRFNLNNLTVLLTHLASTEEHAIAAQYYQQNFPNITLNSSLKDPQHPDRGVDMVKYRKLYYEKAGVAVNDQHAVWNYCKQYIQGLEWVHFYYHSRPKNWQWFFPYHYTPLVMDIVDYLTNASSGSRLTRVSNKYLEPILPFQQLLCVVPPRSKILLPRFLQYLYKNKLVQYYPEKYLLDLEGKTREWEAIAILPFIQIEDVFSAYQHAEKRATEKKIRTKFARNKPGKDIRYWYSATVKYNYNSDYGRIHNCSVEVRTL
uniref:XRN 5'-3' exonuclease n=1 Tax=Marseillevirus LCMAC201 TaxID=2506605 RepID=A0A481YWI8_9VIRU|nr:MAG: XRN 5'-3' exonuclease [Marseillevirus LCMAC201]